MPGREENEDFTTEYARFALNSRGIPEDFDTWISDMNGNAPKKRKPKNKKMTRDNGFI